jgi:hypothetical protein
MNARKHGLTNIVAVGVVVLLLTSLGLFWARCLCGTLRHEVLSEMAGPVTIRPSHLLPGETEHDPNSAWLSSVQARTPAWDPLLAGLGIVRYVETHRPGGSRSDIYRWSRAPDETWIYFDRSLGLIVYRGKELWRRGGGTTAAREVTLYAGPEGMSTTPDEQLGRFVQPLGDFTGQPWIVYDSGLRRFFVIKDWQHIVERGPQLPPNDTHRPVQIGLLAKNPLSLEFGVLFGPSSRRASTDASSGETDAGRSPHPAVWYLPLLEGRALVLDASGRIDLLDLDTLEFVGTVAHLPRPAALFSAQGVAAPQDVAAYAVEPVTQTAGHENRGDRRPYVGCAVATLSADATAVRVEVFDPNGQALASGQTEFAPYLRVEEQRTKRRVAVESAYFDVPGAAAVTGLKFALESLHPPVLLLLSYFTAPHFEATAGYRSLLLLPSSFVALKARDTRTGPVGRFMGAEMLMLPAFFLALVLAGLVARDGARAGLPKNARTMWAAATLVFGLPAYITYRLTRPGIRMVTCQNCGQMRRPDQERCHRCGSRWVVPELTPPAWRVLDEGGSTDGWETEQTQPGTAAPHGETAAEAQ